jgi:signal transduction histidine kinase
MRWTAWISVWLALVAASLASLAVVWGLWWSGAEDAVSAALADHLVSEAALVGEHLREVPVDVLAGLGAGHASDAVTAELSRLTEASGLHDAALLGPDGLVLGSGGTWLPAEADVDLVARTRAGHAVAGPLYQSGDGAWYLAAYAPLAGRPGWVVAVEGSATLGAMDRLAARQATAGLAVLALVALLGAVLASRITHPLRTLEAELMAVSPGDPPEGVQLAGPREVRRVAGAARRLLAAIRDRDEAVEEAHTEQLAQVTRLAAEIAHEVRNPLNAMSLSVDRMSRADDPEKRAAFGERLRAEIESLEAIVGRLLHLTRPLAPRIAPTDLAASIPRLAHELKLALVWQGPGTAIVSTDEGLVEEILRNLFLNAAQAGARTMTVRVRPGDPWSVEMTDDGPGIADADAIFDWFHTTRAAGSGLGLPISRRIAAALGARLVLVSAHPATFRLELPGGES